MSPVRRYHFHPPGLVYVIVTLFIAIGALNSQNNLLFAALGLAIGGLLASGIVSGSALMGVRLEREPAPPGTAGRPLTLHYTVRNVNRIVPVFGLHIEEIAAPPRSGAPARPAPTLHGARAFVVHVGPGEAVRVPAVTRPTVRGIAHSSGVRVWSTFPFGLVRKSVFFPQEASVEVHPADIPLQPDLVARLSARAAAGAGAERTTGPGDEFFGLREYLPGDSLRRIAWRPTARTGALVVRQNAAPSPVRLWVVLRLGAAPPEGHGLAADEPAIALAATLLREAHEAGIAAGLAVPLARIALMPRAGRARLLRMLGALARLYVAASRSAGTERFPEAAARAGRGAVCVIVHAPPPDRAYGPPHAHHLDARRPGGWAGDGEPARRVLLMLGAGTGAAP